MVLPVWHCVEGSTVWQSQTCSGHELECLNMVDCQMDDVRTLPAPLWRGERIYGKLRAQLKSCTTIKK